MKTLATKAYTSMGFTLLEMLISISVVSVVLVGASSVTKLGFQHLEKSRDLHLSNQFASSHFALLEQEQRLTLGTSKGAYSERFQWQLQLQALESAKEQISEHKVTAVEAVLTVFSGNVTSEYHSLLLRGNARLNQEADESI